MADAPDLGSGPERVGGSSPLVRTILFQEICKCAVFPDRFLTNLTMNAPRRFGSHWHVASPHLLLKDGKSPRSIKQFGFSRPRHPSSYQTRLQLKTQKKLVQSGAHN